MRGAVVLHDHGMVDRHVCSALLEVLGDGVAALAHDLRDERVGLGHRGRRLIDEGPLRRGPALGVALARRGFQVADLQLRAPVARSASSDSASPRSPRSARTRPYSGPKSFCSCCDRRLRMSNTASTTTTTTRIATMTHVTMDSLSGGGWKRLAPGRTRTQGPA